MRACHGTSMQPASVKSEETSDQRIIVWDLPIRVFHVAFAACCAGSLAIALFVDDESGLFAWHMLLGIAACFLLAVRLAIGLFGSRHNRLKSMLFSPAETFRYLGGAITGKLVRYPIHNPATSAAAFGMFLLVPLLLWTGLGSSGEAAEDLHGFLAYALLGLIAAHLAGLILHAVQSTDGVAISMVTGKKRGPRELGLRSSHPIIGAAVLLASSAWIFSLFSNYNAADGTVKIPVLGSTFSLGENERESGEDDD